jgi:C1A family cysteine protease
LLITGFKRSVFGTRDFYIKNSWVSYWGVNGRTWFNQEYIMSDLSEDFWVPTLIPNLVF